MAEATSITTMPPATRRWRLAVALRGPAAADAVLLALAARWQAAHDAFGGLPVTNSRPSALRLSTGLLCDMREAELDMAQLPARTSAGLRAKARALLAYMPCDARGAIIETATEDQWLAWSLGRDLLDLPIIPANRRLV